MACKSRESVNRFHFLRFDKVTGGTKADLPIIDLCPITEAVAPGFEPETIAWSGVTGIVDNAELTRIDTLIKAMKLSGNWDLIDYLLILDQGVPGLYDLKGLVQANVFGGVTFDAQGAEGNGIDGYIDTGWNPSTDGINHVLDNAFISSMVLTVGGGGDSAVNFGARAIATSRSYMTDGDATFINNGVTTDPAPGLTSDTLRTVYREDSTNVFIGDDGVQVGTEAQPSTTVPNTDIDVFRLAGADAFYSDSKLGMVAAGAAVGFDHTAFNTEIRTYLGI